MRRLLGFAMILSCAPFVVSCSSQKVLSRHLDDAILAVSLATLRASCNHDVVVLADPEDQNDQAALTANP